MNHKPLRPPRVLGVLCVEALLFLHAAVAQTPGGPFASPSHFEERDGAAIYADVCQSCHMRNGKGATGAGTYPSLAFNQKLEQPGYPVLVVLHGLHGMPPFAGTLDDGQIAAVVTYVRTHFGNHDSGTVSAADVQAARQ